MWPVLKYPQALFSSTGTGSSTLLLLYAPTQIPSVLKLTLIIDVRMMRHLKDISAFEGRWDL